LPITNKGENKIRRSLRYR